MNTPTTTTFDKAVADLKKVKSVNEWNEVRASYVSILTRQELAKIDSGLIIEVLGKDA